MSTRGRGRPNGMRTARVLLSAGSLAGLLELALGGASARAATMTSWTGLAGDNVFNNTANWSNGLASGTGYDADFTLAPSSYTYNSPTLSAATEVNGLFFDAAGWTVGGSYTLTTAADGVTVDATGAATGTTTVSAPLTLGASENVNVYSGNTLVLSGPVASGSGDWLNATGPGIIELTGTASGLGDVNASAGTVELNISGTTGGKLEANGAGTVEYLASNQLSATSVYRIDGSGEVNLNGNSQTLASVSFRTNAANGVGTGAGSISLDGGTLTITGTSTTGAFNILTANSGSSAETTISGGTLALGGTSVADEMVCNDAAAPVDLDVSANISGSNGLTRAGLGTAVFSGADTYTGTTTLALKANSTTYGAGTLELDFSAAGAPTSNILYNGVTPGEFAADGGTLILNGNSTTAVTQTFGSLGVAGNAATSIQLLTNNSQSLLLNIGTFTTRSAAGSVVDFTLPSGSPTSTNGILTSTANTHSIIGPWATVGGTDWATNSAGTGQGNIVAFTSYATFPQSGGASSTNALLSGSSSVSGTDQLSTLKITDTGASQSLALGANNLTAAGLLYVGGSTNAYSISGTTGVLGDGTANEFIANVASGANLTISAPLVSTTATAGILTKAGAGTLTYSGASGYTGATYISGGTLALSNASNSTPLGNTAITVNTGTTLALIKNGSTITIGAGGASVKLMPAATLNLADGTIGAFNIDQTGSTAALQLVGDDTLQFGVSNAGADEITTSGGSAAMSFGTSTNGFIATNTVNIVPVGNSLASSATYPLINDGAEGGVVLADFSLADPTVTVGGQMYDLSLSSPSTDELDLNVLAAAVPEPATGVFLLVLGGMMGLRRRRSGKSA